ncbi:MAG: membrane protein insertase YidC, partial [Candidatus Omnitrophica bacterium]|nr:membrane protein insertase YidC [Candidatus Omnitrophota bacterium]
MEKRLVLSFVLSFLVLYVWAALAPKKPTPTPSHPTQDNSTVNDVAVNSMDPDIVPGDNGSAPVFTGEVFVLENEKLLLEFSSSGASLTHVILKEYEEELPVDHIGGFEQFSKKDFVVRRNESNLVEFSHTTESLLVTRRYEIDEDSYTLRVVDSVKNFTEMSNEVRLDIIGFTLNMDDSAGGHSVETPKQADPSANRDRGLNEYAISSEQGIKRKNNAYKFAVKEESSIDSPVKWLAFRNRYYATIVKPEFETSGYSTKVLGEKAFQIRLNSQDLQLSPGQQVDFQYTAFVGPEKTEILKAYDAGFEDIKRYY